MSPRSAPPPSGDIVENPHLRAIVLLAAAVTLFGVVLRIASPWHAFYWNDEIWTSLQSSGHSLADVVQATAANRATTAGDFVQLQELRPGAAFGTFLRSDPHTSPLFYSLCWAALHLFDNHVQATRTLAALLGCLGLGAIFWMARTLWESRIAAWLAVSIAAISPIQLYLSYEARPYVLWLATTALATHALLYAHRSSRRWPWVGYGLASALLLYSHLYGAFTLLAHAAYLAASPATTRRIWVSFTAALALGGALCVPWIAWVATHLRAVRILTAWLARPASLAERLDAAVKGVLWQFGTFESAPASELGRILLVLLVVATWAWALAALFREESAAAAVLVSALVFAIPLALLTWDLVAGGRRATILRYYAPSWIGLTVLLARFGERQLGRFLAVPRHARRASAGVSAALVVALITWGARGAWTMFRSRMPDGKPDAFAAAAAVEIARATHPAIVSPGLVTMMLLVSNGVPATTPVVEVRLGSLQPKTIATLARDHEVFFLRPAPAPYFEPLRGEAAQIERQLGGQFEIREVTPSLMRLVPAPDA